MPRMTAAIDLPLLTLHPVADAQHRWVAILIEASAAAPDVLLATVDRWLADGLREALGNLPCILPPLPADAIDLAAAVNVMAANSVLRIILPDDSAAALAALTALDATLRPTQGHVRLLHAGLADLHSKLPSSVQGQAAAGAPLTAHAPSGGPGPHLALALANTADAVAARHAGWAWLAGNYTHDTPAAARAGGGRSIMLKLLSQITLDADDGDIEKTLKQDPNLSFQLLRLVNSVGVAARAPITTFRQAIATLGRRQLQRWLQLLLYAQQGDGQVNPLLPVAAWRASLMEALAAAHGMNSSDQDAAFMVGMFSRLDVLFGQSLTDILAPLGLDAKITDALLTRSGPLAPLLAIVEATEQVADGGGADGALDARLAQLGLDHAAWCQAQTRSMGWVLRICREL